MKTPAKISEGLKFMSYANIKSLVGKMKYKLKVYLRFFQFRLFPKKKNDIVEQFHKLYYDSNILGGTWKNTFFLGIATQKCPFDLFIYQEILYELKPDVIVELGTAFGGGALFLASICDLINNGEVISVDINDINGKPSHKRIKYLIGSSISNEIVGQVKELIKNKNKVLIILDSDHSKGHVLKELMIYSKLVSLGSYIIVEDSNIHGHPVQPDHGPGPAEAIEEYFKEYSDFMVDKSREKFYLTFNPGGYLKKIK